MTKKQRKLLDRLEDFKNDELIVKFAIVYAFVGLALTPLTFQIYNASGTMGTDEPAFAAFYYPDILSGKNPYATEHSVPGTPNSTFVYFPLLIFVQIPFINYLVTLLIFYILTIVVLRNDPIALFIFANPVTACVMYAGFNDFIPIFFMIFAIKQRNRIAKWLSCGCKQFSLPIFIVVDFVKKDYKAIFQTIIVTSLICLPFFVWDPQAFVNSAILKHIPKIQEISSGVKLYPNYWLYPLTLCTLYYGYIIRKILGFVTKTKSLIPRKR